jgi:hypothetical protein
MPTQDAPHIREKILSILRMKGPTLPVYIAQDTGMSMLFASAFLSELLSDKKIKMSHMRVGNSPIYFIPGQEPQLEKFSSYLKSKEKDAFILLQERKFLKDSEQSPAIRVALRVIRDFAFHFKKNDEIYWRYLTASESEFKHEIKPIEEHKYIEAKPKIFDKEERKISEKIIKDIKIEEINKEIEEDEDEDEEEERIEEIEISKEIEIKEVPKEKKKEKDEKPKAKIKQIKAPKKKSPQKQDDKFFNKIKEFLSKETIEILNVESFKKNEILLRIKSEGNEKLLVAYNKRKISDIDIINANKKASQLNLKYTVLSMGEPSKKLSNLIESAQNLEKIEKIEK